MDGTYAGTNYTGGAANDKFIANDAGTGGATPTWTSMDKIDGGAGTNTFNVTSASAIAVPAGATVDNIATVSLASPSTVNVDASTFTGLTKLTATSVGAGAITVGAGVAVVDTNTLGLGVGSTANVATTVDGGSNVTLAVTGASITVAGGVDTIGNVVVGGTTAPTGDVVVTATETTAIAATGTGNVTVKSGGGANLTVTINDTIAHTASQALVSGAAPAQAAGSAGNIVVTGGTGAVVVNSAFNSKALATATQNADAITVTGGSTITVNQTVSAIQTATSVSTVAEGAVTVLGNASTTAVTVTQAAAATGKLAVTTATAAVAGTPTVSLVTASQGVTGVTAVTAVNKVTAIPVSVGTATVTNGAVAIADKSAGSSTVANTITTVTLGNYGASTISSTALNTVNLSGTGGTLGLTFGGSAATIAANKTLGLNIGSASTLGVITDSSAQISTVNVNLGASSTLAGITDSALRTVNLSGTGVLTLTAVNSAITSITESGAAGFNGNISGTGITAFSGANSTGANTVTINAATQSYTGGAGADAVTVAADAAKAITGGGGANTLFMDASVVSTVAGMRANVSGFQTLSSSSTTGTIDMSTMPADITALVSTGTSGGVTFSNVADGTTLALTGAHSGGTSQYLLASTGGWSKSVSVALGQATSDSVLFGTINLKDVNGNGIGTVSLASNGYDITAGDATPNYNTLTAIGDTAITQLNVSGAQGLVITSYTDAVTGLTINNTNTGSYGLSIPNLIDPNLDTLTFTGSGKVDIAGINDGSVTNLTVTNSGTGSVNIGQIWTSNSGTADTTSLVGLTLNGNITTGTKAAPLEIASTGTITVSGATDNAGVALSFTASNSNALTITLGNGNNYLDLGQAAAGSAVYSGGGTVTTGSGMDYIWSKFDTSSSTKAWTINAGAGDDAIFGGQGYSKTLSNVYIGGDGADYIQTGTGAVNYDATAAAAGKYAFVAFAGSQTTGTTVSTVNSLGGTWSGTLYAESQDTVISTGINKAFSDLFAGSLVNTSGAGKIFAGANIISNYYAQDAIAVASTGKDVFLFQTANDQPNVAVNHGTQNGVMNIENFKIGQDIIAVTNYQGSGDNLFVGSAAAVTAINAVTASEALLASANGWSYAADENSSTSGTLSYVGGIGGSNPTYANMSIHLVGIQGTPTNVDSFFYQG